MFSSLATGFGKTCYFWSWAAHRRVLALFPREMEFTCSLCLFNLPEGKEHLFASCMSRKLLCHLKWFYTLWHSHSEWIVCAWAAEKTLIGAWTFKGWVPATGGHWWAQWSVWHSSNLFWLFWRGQDLPSRSGQLWIICLVPALEKVRNFGRPRLEENKITRQFCHSARAFYAKDSLQDTNSRLS